MLRNLTPDLIVARLVDIDQDRLAERGIRALLLDVDNTICAWHCEQVHPDCCQWLAKARERFRVCLVSNSTKPKRLGRIADSIDVPAVGRWGLGRKPFRGGIAEGLRLTGADAGEAAMIGDQLLTDVLGGNRMGLYTIWVLPLQQREFIGTKPARLVEHLLARRFARQGLMPEDVD